jgi:hypothetical protein
MAPLGLWKCYVDMKLWKCVQIVLSAQVSRWMS